MLTGLRLIGVDFEPTCEKSFVFSCTTFKLGSLLVSSIIDDFFYLKPPPPEAFLGVMLLPYDDDLLDTLRSSFNFFLSSGILVPLNTLDVLRKDGVGNILELYGLFEPPLPGDLLEGYALISGYGCTILGKFNDSLVT